MDLRWKAPQLTTESRDGLRAIKWQLKEPVVQTGAVVKITTMHQAQQNKCYCCFKGASILESSYIIHGSRGIL